MSGREYHFRIEATTLGGHTHLRLFSGTEHSKGLCAEQITMRNEEWVAFASHLGFLIEQLVHGEGLAYEFSRSGPRRAEVVNERPAPERAGLHGALAGEAWADGDHEGRDEELDELEAIEDGAE